MVEGEGRRTNLGPGGAAHGKPHACSLSSWYTSSTLLARLSLCLCSVASAAPCNFCEPRAGRAFLGEGRYEGRAHHAACAVNLSSLSRAVVLTVLPCFIMRFLLLLALAIAALLVLCARCDSDRHVREALASLLGAPLDQLPEAQLVAALDAGSTEGHACSYAVCLNSLPATSLSSRPISVILSLNATAFK